MYVKKIYEDICIKILNLKKIAIKHFMNVKLKNNLNFL